MSYDYTPFTCVHCGQKIDQVTDFAGEIVWRGYPDNEMPLHPNCAPEWDAEVNSNPPANPWGGPL